MAQTEQATQDMSKNWDERVAESKQDIKVKQMWSGKSQVKVLKVVLREFIREQNFLRQGFPGYTKFW